MTLSKRVPGTKPENAPLLDAEETTSTATFQGLGLESGIIAALTAAGITEPFPIQSLTIADALAGKDICGKAKTGSGKTLAFGLPLIQLTSKSRPRAPRAVVLVPTRELATQIVRNLGPIAASRRVRLAAIYGGASINRQADQLRAGVDVVVATPGRLHDLLERGACTMDDIRTVVLDEADQMADLGFLPQVERILNRIPERPQTLLFSATLDGDVDRLVKRYQQDPVFHEVVSAEETVSTMAHRFILVNEAEKVAVAATIASGPDRILFFARTQRGVERLVKQLDREGVRAEMIHGGMSQPKRERALAAFASGHALVLVATNIAARGIHVDGVDIVVHHDPPDDAKTYLHRSGRTARAGASGLVVTLVEQEQLSDVNAFRRQAGLREAIVPMGPDDPRLRDLAGWEPDLEQEPTRARQTLRESVNTGASSAPRRPYRGSAPAGRRPFSGQGSAPRGAAPNAGGRGPQGHSSASREEPAEHQRRFVR